MVFNTFKEVLENWKNWIILAVIVGVLGFLKPISLIGWLLASIYAVKVIKEKKVVDFRDALNVDNFIIWLKSLVTGFILALPIIVIIFVYSTSLLFYLMKSPVPSLLGIVQHFMVIFLLAVIWGYIISPGAYITILKNSVLEGIKKFYKISLTLEYFVEWLKVTLLSLLLSFIVIILALIPLAGVFLAILFAFSIKVFVSLYLARIIDKILVSKGL